MPDENKLTHADMNNGAGLAAYFMMIELTGLLRGMGLQDETVAELMTRARVEAQKANSAGRSPAFRAALQLLLNLETKYRVGPLPKN